MPNPVTTADVAARYPEQLSTQQTINAQAYLADAWAMVLRRRPALEANLAAAPPLVTEADVRRVVANMVVRKLLNPEGKSEESIDDYRFKFGGDVFGELYISDDELMDLTPATATSIAGRGSVRLVAYGES